MEIPVFLAMTAAEAMGGVFAGRMGWMSCHFSDYGPGLSNLPSSLPKGSMLMLNDRVPFRHHDPLLVAQTLCSKARELECDRILLDFQHHDPQVAAVIGQVLKLASCPVGVSSLYARDFDCPVLAEPIAPHVYCEDALKCWAGREIWLELSTGGVQIDVTEEGSAYSPAPFYEPPENAHEEPELHGHYEISYSDDRIVFQIGRTKEDLSALLADAGAFGVTCGVGLYQELGWLS